MAVSRRVVVVHIDACIPKPHEPFSAFTGSAAAHIWPGHMTLRCVVEHAVESQNDIVRDRPSGSSCCTLFCSGLALNVLRLLPLPASPAQSALSMPALKALLIEAVRDWDTTGLVEGAEAHTVLFSNMELKVFAQEHFVERQAL